MFVCRFCNSRQWDGKFDKASYRDRNHESFFIRGHLHAFQGAKGEKIACTRYLFHTTGVELLVRSSLHPSLNVLPCVYVSTSSALPPGSLSCCLI